jgi:hypothetical protein
MTDIFPSIPPATEIHCEASALASSASGRFGELKKMPVQGYFSLIPTGHRNSLCGLCFSKKCFWQFRGTEE